MAIISFTKFDLGIDHRKGPTVSDANRLQELKNGYVTTGLAISKRQGLTKIGDLTPGTRGLFRMKGNSIPSTAALTLSPTETRFLSRIDSLTEIHPLRPCITRITTTDLFMSR